MNTYLIKEATVINEGSIKKASVYIEKGKIKEIFEGEIPSGLNNVSVVDASDSILIPGVIDDQVHFREPGLTHKGDLYTESRAAVSGGTTSFMDMPNLVPQTTSLALLEEKHEIAASKALGNYGFYLGGTNENWKELTSSDLNLACGIKIFMGSSTGNMLVDSKEVLHQFFANSKILIATHCEDEATIRHNLATHIAQYGEDIPMHLHPIIRSEEACYRSSSLAVELAQRYGTRLHILHISTEKELSLFTQGDLQNKNITGEACVHHMWFDDRDYERYGAKIKWNPAIKKPSDKLAIREAIRTDLLDVVATDHAPHTWDEKKGAYTQAASGGPLSQHALQAMFELYEQGVFSREKIIEKMCHAPARLFGVRDRGFIRKGYYADLVLLKKQNHTVTKDNIRYKCGWSPFEGTTFSYSITDTFVNGHRVFSNGQFDESQKGQALTYSR